MKTILHISHLDLQIDPQYVPAIMNALAGAIRLENCYSRTGIDFKIPKDHHIEFGVNFVEDGKIALELENKHPELVSVEIEESEPCPIPVPPTRPIPAKKPDSEEIW